ncbi:Protein CBG13107 [Caenorhabditis briggsae]|uniref:Protein CBG13107 n=1 Tax=Caenorhabditis briggsae TaxID=6238 RepID=A8XH37_CAEBR|nr:Protein CBG13107 [Caenorhabditis briggsae]CAP31961.1 Protein CBG13107 [Caenorhabditis briggsae]
MGTANKVSFEFSKFGQVIDYKKILPIFQKKKSTISARSMRSAMSTMPSNSRIRQDFNNRIGCNLEVHGVSGRMSGMSGMSPMSTMTTISRTRIFSKFSLPTVMYQHSVTQLLILSELKMLSFLLDYQLKYQYPVFIGSSGSTRAGKNKRRRINGGKISAFRRLAGCDDTAADGERRRPPAFLCALRLILSYLQKQKHSRNTSYYFEKRIHFESTVAGIEIVGKSMLIKEMP